MLIVPLFRSNPIAIDLVSHHSYTEPFFPLFWASNEILQVINEAAKWNQMRPRKAATSTQVCSVPCYSAELSVLKLHVDNKHFAQGCVRSIND